VRPLLALVLAAALAGCSASASQSSGPGQGAAADSVAFRDSGFGACPAQTGPPLRTAAALPDLTLPCMDGSGPVTLDRATSVPLVVNLWGSWCGPCAKELPAFQRLHSSGTGKVAVLGVVTRDSAAASVAAAKDLKLTFPNVHDPKSTVREAIGRNALPVTLFVTRQGRVAHVYNGQPLTDGSLRELVKRYLGVEM
jgi:thiol-disulfide isomerase/thioredoxin